MPYTWEEKKRFLAEEVRRGNKLPAERYAESQHEQAFAWRLKGCLAAALNCYAAAAWAYDLIGRTSDARFCRSRMPETDENGRITPAAIARHELEMRGRF